MNISVFCGALLPRSKAIVKVAASLLTAKGLSLSVLLCCGWLATASCQSPTQGSQSADSVIWGNTADGGEIFLIVDHDPEFPGGIDSLYSFLNRNIHYPEKAKEQKIEGRIYTQFIVEKDGRITHAKILRDIVYGNAEADSLAAELGCSAEVLRVINMMPKWHPASNHGTIVRYQFCLPVKFSLSEGIINPNK